MHYLEDFPGHFLSPIKSKWIPDKWIFFDSETHTVTKDLVNSEYFTLGWTCYWDRWSKFYPGLYEWKFWDKEEEVCKYIDQVVRREKQITFVGHNIFFDLQACGFFKYFTEWKWKLDFIYDKGLTYILRCKKSKSTLTILSTTNWFDQSLEKLGENLGLSKGKIDFDTATLDELKVYCRRDVEILVEAIRYYISFLRKHSLGKMCLTKSSQAFSSYRHVFMSHKIMLHTKPEATFLEREAYIGGRVECFRLGEQKGNGFVSLDVNKMYPFVMKVMQYPWELVEYNGHMDIASYMNILKSHAVIAEVEIDTPEPAFAVRIKGKTIFPVGQFRCFLCSTGMKYALNRGYIKKIINIAVYRKADLFSEYVDYFDRIRIKYKEDNNTVMELLCKYFHNSLYGKFAEKKVIRDEYDEYTGREYFREEVINIDTGELTIMTKLMNKFIVQYNESEGENAFPAIAAHITENARFLLWEIICGIGPDQVLYCDTDSVKIHESDMQYVKWPLHEITMGALKIEDYSEELFLGGCKNYRTEKHRHIKGIPLRAIEIAPNVFKYLQFHGQNIHLRQGQIHGAQVSQSQRVVSFTYDKGVVHDDGRVTPFQLSLP